MINKQQTYANIRKSFGLLTQKQVDGFEAIFNYWNMIGYKDSRWLAYMLATVWHECGKTMQPIEEYGKGKTKPYGQKFKFSKASYSLPNKIYYGRGFVQLTWFENYDLMGRIFAVDLLNKPELALDLELATKIMFYGMTKGSFTGKRLNQYFNDIADNPIGARKIINGEDKAELIRDYHVKFLKCII